MFAAFVLTLAAFGIMQQTVSGAWRFTMQYWSVLRGGVLVFSVGLWDDYGRLSYRIKFAVQLLASSLVYANGFGVAQLAGFELFPVVCFGLTVFWFLLFINAVNLLDGLDGLFPPQRFPLCPEPTEIRGVWQNGFANFAPLDGGGKLPIN